MAFLFEELWFAPQSRMTGVWTHPAAGAMETESVASVHQIRLGACQDGVIESDFLASHLPYFVGGLHGVGPDGIPWVVLSQVAPAQAAAAVGSRNPYWPLIDGVERAIHYNGEAEVLNVRAWSRDELIGVYERHGIDAGELVGWTTGQLMYGLLAECCAVELRDIVAGAAEGCAFPHLAHDCRGDVFRDVFARWATGAVTDFGTQEPFEDEDEAVDEPRALLIGYCWPKDLLDAWSTPKLRKVARRAGWKRHKVARMSRSQLTQLLTKPRRRRRPGAYRLMRVPLDSPSTGEN